MVLAAAEPERTPATMRNPHVPKFPVIIAKPTFQQIRDNINQRDVTQSALLSIACFPLGYLMTRQIDRAFAVRGMLFMGVLGSIGSGLLAYQNSELRLKGFGRNDDELARYGPAPQQPERDE